jgi:aminoglycoside phosphotransferase (APT) family kinase protein
MMVAEIAPGATTRNARPIQGGLATDTFGVDTTAGDFVVKVFRPDRREGALLEWERLTFAQRAEVPVPEPVALDADGRWFGAPALVMSRLPGRGDVRPSNLDRWLRQLAHALAAIHETNTTGAAGPLLRPGNWGNRELATTVSGPTSTLVDRVVEAIRQHRPSPDGPSVLLHGDFHPGNIIWSQGTLSGVVDWSGARLGPRWFDLAYCRADVALLFGMRGVRRLTEHYVDIVGAAPVDLPVFDLMCGLAAQRFGTTQWLGAFRHQGCTDSRRQFAARVPPFLRQALAELGA